MIPRLDACFDGPLSPWRDMLALAGDHPDAVPARRLLEPGGARAIIDRFAASHPGADRRVVVSMWTQWYFNTLLIPVTAALALGFDLPVAIREVGLVVEPDGRPKAIVLRHDGRGGEPAAERFGPLLDRHVAPLIGHLAPRFRVSARLLWCNAGAVLDWTLGQLATTGVPDAIAEGRRRLDAPLLPDGGRNPLARTVVTVADAPRRRLCCLRYLLPGVAGCGALCPLPEVNGSRHVDPG